MLKQRVLTALVLAALLLSALFAKDTVYWQVLVNAAILVGFWEWLRLSKIDSHAGKAVFLALYIGACYALQTGLLPTQVVIVAACVLWLVLLIFMATSVLDFLHNPVLKGLIGVTVVSVAGWLVIELRNLDHGALWVVCCFLAIVCADIGAYFVGKRFGKTKLAPVVSPGKTVEGFAGGIGFVLLLFAPVLFSIFEPKKAALLLLVVAATSLVSVGGDLLESKIKRFSGFKDSGTILPGHGGVLDRIDSILAGVPVFALGLVLLGIM